MADSGNKFAGDLYYYHLPDYVMAPAAVTSRFTLCILSQAVGLGNKGDKQICTKTRGENGAILSKKCGGVAHYGRP